MKPAMHPTPNNGPEPTTLCRECHTISPGHRYACTNPRCGGYYPGPKHLTHGFCDRQGQWLEQKQGAALLS